MRPGYPVHRRLVAGDERHPPLYLALRQNRQVLSIGRVQTPTLALIVNRQAEIDNFKPEPYWELKTIYRNTTFLRHER